MGSPQLLQHGKWDWKEKKAQIEEFKKRRGEVDQSVGRKYGAFCSTRRASRVARAGDLLCSTKVPGLVRSMHRVLSGLVLSGGVLTCAGHENLTDCLTRLAIE